MKQSIKYVLIASAAGLIGWFMSTRKATHGDVLNNPPTDSGFAIIQVDERNAKPVFAYKYGDGKDAKYQILWMEDRMDTLRFRDQSGKDSLRLVPRLAANGRPEQNITTPFVPAKYILQWWSKPTK